jgi:hypothetical protein
MNKQNILLDFEEFSNSYSQKSASFAFRRLFPIYLEDSITEEYSYLIGKVMGDGNLDKNFTLRFIGKEEDLLLLSKLITEKFGIDPKRLSIRGRVCKGVSYILSVNCAYLGRILSLLGAPIGNKTKTKFNVPEWISSDSSKKKRFLQALLEDELTTIKIERCNYSISPHLKLAKKEKLIPDLIEFMSQVKQTIESFGVECGPLSRPVKAEPSLEMHFHIQRNKNNILKFRDEIGFRLNQDKIRKLDECCRIIKNSLDKK